MLETLDYQEAEQELDTILDIVRWLSSQFNAHSLFFGHGTDNPWDEALLLVLTALYLPVDSPDSLFSAKVTKTERKRIFAIAKQRIEQRIPLPYLLNQSWFCGLPFYVDSRVLIPRSPFAELINQGFKDWLDQEPHTLLDMCTGSGCIAIALAHTFEDAQVDAVDISLEALEVAEHNIHDHNLSERVFPIQSDLFSQLAGQHYDLIVCNPPYVDAEDMGDLPEEFTHEPRLALEAGEDGLEMVEIILAEAPKHLTEHGWLFVEVGNSLIHMASRFPQLPITWVNLENGGDGIFAINRSSLIEYQQQS